jgi:hypothetical protein
VARKIAQLSIMLALAVAGAGLSAAPANAADVDLYQNRGGTGGYFGAGATAPTYHGYYFNNGTRLWDAVTSLRNNRGNWTTFWTNAHCSGSGYSVAPYTERPYVGATFNDTFSSHAPEWVRNGC